MNKTTLSAQFGDETTVNRQSGWEKSIPSEKIRDASDMRLSRESADAALTNETWRSKENSGSSSQYASLAPPKPPRPRRKRLFIRGNRSAKALTRARKMRSSGIPDTTDNEAMT